MSSPDPTASDLTSEQLRQAKEDFTATLNQAVSNLDNYVPSEDPKDIEEFEQARALLDGRTEAKQKLAYGCTEGSPTTAREAFIAHLQNRYPDHAGEPRPNVITDLKTLIGEDGIKLFKAALREEAQSAEFRSAVFANSAMGFKGEPWAKRPVLYMGGPSGSGKSSATKQAIEENQGVFGVDSSRAAQSQETSPPHQNWVVACDGGEVRATSQMRNLMCDFATSLGYADVSDLQSSADSILSPVKKRVKEAVLATDDIGLGEPVTFTNPKELLNMSKTLSVLEQNPKNRALFINVVPENADAVALQGQTRSRYINRNNHGKIGYSSNRWTQGGSRPELKPYSKKGFWVSRLMTFVAEKLFRRTSKDGLVIKAKNDLTTHPELVHPISPKVLNRWEAFKEHFSKALTSDLVIEEKASGNLSQEELEQAKDSLPAYLALCKKLEGKEIQISLGDDSPPIPLTGSTRLPFEMRTSSLVKVALAHQKIKQYEDPSSELEKVCVLLDAVEEKGYSELLSEGCSLEAYKKSIQDALDSFTWKQQLFTQRPLVKALEKLNKALDEAIIEQQLYQDLPSRESFIEDAEHLAKMDKHEMQQLLDVNQLSEEAIGEILEEKKTSHLKITTHAPPPPPGHSLEQCQMRKQLLQELKKTVREVEPEPMPGPRPSQ